MGDGEHDQDDEEPAPVGSSTSTAGERVVAMIAGQHASVPLRHVRAGELREEFLYELKAGQRAASGRPRPADQPQATATHFPPVSVVRARCIAEPPRLPYRSSLLERRRLPLPERPTAPCLS